MGRCITSTSGGNRHSGARIYARTRNPGSSARRRGPLRFRVRADARPGMTPLLFTRRACPRGAWCAGIDRRPVRQEGRPWRRRRRLHRRRGGGDGPHGRRGALRRACSPGLACGAVASAALPHGPACAGRRRQRVGLRRLVRRRQRQRAGIVAAGGLDQCLDAAFDRRVGREQVGEFLARIVDAHLHHRGGRAGQFAAALDLAQRRDHRIGVLGELDRARIGEEFARARQREPDQQREQPGDRDQRDRDDDGEPAAALAAVLAAA